MKINLCRNCKAELNIKFIDLGFSPPSNQYLNQEQLSAPEKYYPLRVHVCDKCWLVQTEDYAKKEDLFVADYAYFSGASKSWLKHSQNYVDTIIDRLRLTKKSFVVELASNDGYLLKNFVAKSIPCLGIEPTKKAAEYSRAIGINVIVDFFSERLAEELKQEKKTADLIIGNNVYAHVPDINDFTRGMKTLLNADGVITLEFPHVQKLIAGSQFDTIYHEHYSYLSLHTVKAIFEQNKLTIFDVEELNTHGGSLRIYACHTEANHTIKKSVEIILQDEIRNNLNNKNGYGDIQEQAITIKNNLLEFLLTIKKNGKKIVGYGAAAKGNTLLNFAGIKEDLLPVVYDTSESKQGKYMPGSHIIIKEPKSIYEVNPDYILVLPWNLISEISNDLSDLRGGGTKLVTCIPKIEII